MHQSTTERIPIIGEITALVHRQDVPFFKLWNRALVFLNESGLIRKKTLEKWYAKGECVKKYETRNVIANVGFGVLAEVLTGDYGDQGFISQMALGDGVGSPSSADVALFNEVYRNNKASSTASLNVAIVTAFFTEAEVDGTFTEFGNFIDDTILWSHVNVSWTKTDQESLTVQCKYTFSN